MGKIYTVQPIEIEIGYVTLPGTIASVAIKYKNPSKVEGSFVATLDEVNKLVKYKSLATESLVDFSDKPNGDWVFWNSFVCTDGAEFPGEPFTQTIYLEGK